MLDSPDQILKRTVTTLTSSRGRGISSNSIIASYLIDFNVSGIRHDQLHSALRLTINESKRSEDDLLLQRGKYCNSILDLIRHI